MLSGKCEIFQIKVNGFIFHQVMYVLKFKCCFIYAVFENIILSNQVYLNNKFIGHDFLLKNGRRHNNFDYNFNDWEENSTQNILLDYNLDVTLKDNNDEYHNNDVQTSDHTYPTSDGVSITETDTTPILFVTITSDAPENTTPVPVAESTTSDDLNQTTPIDFDEETVNELHPPTSPETQTIPEPLEVSTTPTVATEAITPNETTTTELVLTFPSSHATNSQLYYSIFPTDMGIRYPPYMTYPEFNPKPYEPNPLSMMFTRQIPTISTTEGVVVQEAHQDMQNKKAGYLTTFLLELCKIMATKNKTDASRLFQGFEAEVNMLDSVRQLSGFGKSTVASFLTLVRTMNGVPPDVVQSQAALGYYLLTDRRVTLPSEVVAVLDLADEMYLKTEGERILAVLQEIKDFPDTLKSARAIAHEMMEAVVMTPFKRMYGGSREKYLVQRLEEVVVKKFFNGVPIERRQGVPILRTVFLKVTKTKRTIISPTPLIDSTTTILTPLPKKYAIFSKNKTIFDSFQSRMVRYQNRKEKKRRQWYQWRKKHRIVGGVMKTRVTRKKKSIYVIKKYVKKNLNRLKKRTTQPQHDSEERKPINRDFNKFKRTRKLKYTTNGIKRVTTKKATTTSPEKTVIVNPPTLYNSIEISKMVKIDIDSKDTIDIDSREARRKKRKKFYNDQYKKTTNHEYVTNDAISKRTDTKVRKFKVAKYLKEQSSITDEEDKLKANLDDALFHSNNKPIFRNGKIRYESHFKSKEKDATSSNGDEETVLKSNIYKAFGYENDFAEAVKTARLLD